MIARPEKSFMIKILPSPNFNSKDTQEHPPPQQKNQFQFIVTEVVRSGHQTGI